MIIKQLRPAIMSTIVIMIITGLVYPGIVTGLARTFFPSQAKGSVVTVNGRAVGSSLLGQRFDQAWYFHPRPSAAGDGYDATASSGTNKGPTDRKLADTLIAGAIASAEKDGAVKGRIPADMVTSSASGLDPHISPANAAFQIARVAAARGADPDKIRELVASHTEGRQFGFLGEPRVNVLELNLAVDKAF
ncbi:MAG TPA: potassium-transporting ATPase subunit KdpC, partial [Gemmatimonadaceae bacterium]|nr:potassium-transporting ATPase subunit KdpC [Gemmatimonadaceae bacterium]